MLMINNYLFARGYNKYLENLIAYLDFDTDDIIDRTGNHDIISINNVTNDATSFIGSGKSANFKRSNSSYIELSKSEAFTLNSKYSISFWIKFSSTNNFEILSKRQTATTNLEFQLSYMGNGELRLRLWSVDVDNYIGFNFPCNLNLSEWYHLVLTYDGGIEPTGIELYIDSVKIDLFSYYVDSGTFTGVINTNYSLKIGIGGAINFLDGNIDELGFWKNQILFQEDVNFLFNEGLGNKPF